MEIRLRKQYIIKKVSRTPGHDLQVSDSDFVGGRVDRLRGREWRGEN